MMPETNETGGGGLLLLHLLLLERASNHISGRSTREPLKSTIEVPTDIGLVGSRDRTHSGEGEAEIVT